MKQINNITDDINITNRHMINKYVGALVGMAIGDALGMPFEFLTRKQILDRYHGNVEQFEYPYPHHPNSSLQAGQYTDDTQLALLIAETLITNGVFNAEDYKHRLIASRKDLRSIGKTTRHALALIEKDIKGKDTKISETGDPESLGCGPLTRAIPLGLWYSAAHQEASALIADAIDAAKITHSHPLVTTATAFVACQIAYLKDVLPESFSSDDFFTFSYRILEPISLIERRDARNEIKGILDSVSQNINVLPSRAQKTFSATGSFSDVFRIALYSFLYNSGSFSDAISCAVMFGGDTDSYGALAGAYSGALHGKNGIPEKLYYGVENSSVIEQLALKLYQTRSERRSERGIIHTV